jgi:hypothetical protein
MATRSICQVRGCVNEANNDFQICSAHIVAIKRGGAEIRIGTGCCIVDGCDKPPHSGLFPYCTAHNARLRRRGSLHQAPMSEVIQHSHGYALVLAKGHPMARGARAYEHRVVFYDQNPSGPGHCHWCGLILEWATTQVDHLNGVRDDNRITNLVASCGPCNRDRAKPAAARAARRRASKLMVNGKWVTIIDAARRLNVTPNSIKARIASGWSVERALTEQRGKTGPRAGR